MPARVRVKTRFFWQDLLGEPVEARYDAIVMNPPFHQGRAAQPEIGRRLIGVAAAALKPRGTLYAVASRNLPYEGALAAAFSRYEQIAGDGAFKVYQAAQIARRQCTVAALFDAASPTNAMPPSIFSNGAGLPNRKP